MPYRRPLATLVGVAIAVMLAGCGTERGPSQADEPEPPVLDETHYADVDGPLEEASLTEVARAADGVVLGRVVKREDSVQIDGTDAMYSVYRVETTESLGKQSLSQFEVVLMTEIGGQAVYFEGRPELSVGDEAIWFVDSFDPKAEVPQYVLSNSVSVLAFDDGGVLINDNHHNPLLAEAEELRTKAAIADAISQAVE